MMLRDRVAILVAGALRLDVSRLLALVADLLATSGLLGAVTRVVTGLAAVVALHAVDTLACVFGQSNQTTYDRVKLTRHVAETTARVAGLAGTATETAAAATVVVTVGRLVAVAGNVADLTTLEIC